MRAVLLHVPLVSNLQIKCVNLPAVQCKLLGPEPCLETLQCTACHSVRYCGTICQMNAWKGCGQIGRPGGYYRKTHKAECAEIKVCYQLLSSSGHGSGSLWY